LFQKVRVSFGIHRLGNSGRLPCQWKSEVQMDKSQK